jgi:hypothetical protein
VYLSNVEWPFKPEATLYVQGWGFWLAILGTLLTIAGFGITIWQIRRSLSVAEATQREIGRIRQMVRAYDANHEVARALAALKGARKGLKTSDWAELGESYGDFAKAAFTIAQLDVEEIRQFNDKLLNSVRYAGKLGERIDGGQNGAVDVVKTGSSIRVHEQMMMSIGIVLQGKVMQ